MTIVKDIVADRIAADLHHRIGLVELVGEAENAAMAGEFDPAEAATLTEVVARIGHSGVRAFGPSWENCEALLRRLGDSARIEVVAG